MDEDIVKVISKILSFLGAISFGVAAKTVIESKKEKVYTKFVFIDLVTACFVGYLILPYLEETEFTAKWRGQILALVGYLGSWILNLIVKMFKTKAGKILNVEDKNDDGN